MTLEKTISKEQIKEKLKNLEEHLPGEMSEVYAFANYLASRLSTRVGWDMVYFLANAELALDDLKRQFDSTTQAPIEEITSTAIKVTKTYTCLKNKIPEIAEIIYGKNTV